MATAFAIASLREQGLACWSDVEQLNCLSPAEARDVVSIIIACVGRPPLAVVGPQRIELPPGALGAAIESFGTVADYINGMSRGRLFSVLQLDLLCLLARQQRVSQMRASTALRRLFIALQLRCPSHALTAGTVLHTSFSAWEQLRAIFINGMRADGYAPTPYDEIMIAKQEHPAPVAETQAVAGPSQEAAPQPTPPAELVVSEPVEVLVDSDAVLGAVETSTSSAALAELFVGEVTAAVAEVTVEPARSRPGTISARTASLMEEDLSLPEGTAVPARLQELYVRAEEEEVQRSLLRELRRLREQAASTQGEPLAQLLNQYTALRVELCEQQAQVIARKEAELATNADSNSIARRTFTMLKNWYTSVTRLSAGYEPLLAALVNAMCELADLRLTIGVGGNLKAGKSTFLNSMLHKRVAAVAVESMSAVPVRFVNDSSATSPVGVLPFNNNMNLIMDGLRRLPTEAVAEIRASSKLTAESLAMLDYVLGEPARFERSTVGDAVYEMSARVHNLVRLVASLPDVYADEFMPLLPLDWSNQDALMTVYLKFAGDYPNNVVFIDTPGVDEAGVARLELGRMLQRVLGLCNFVAVVLDDTRRNSVAQVNLLLLLRDIARQRIPIALIVNKIDIRGMDFFYDDFGINSIRQATINDIVSALRETPLGRTASSIFTVERVFPVSAKFYLIGNHVLEKTRSKSAIEVTDEIVRDFLNLVMDASGGDAVVENAFEQYFGESSDHKVVSDSVNNLVNMSQVAAVEQYMCRAASQQAEAIVTAAVLSRMSQRVRRFMHDVGDDIGSLDQARRDGAIPASTRATQELLLQQEKATADLMAMQQTVHDGLTKAEEKSRQEIDNFFTSRRAACAAAQSSATSNRDVERALRIFGEDTPSFDKADDAQQSVLTARAQFMEEFKQLGDEFKTQVHPVLQEFNASFYEYAKATVAKLQAVAVRLSIEFSADVESLFHELHLSLEGFPGGISEAEYIEEVRRANPIHSVGKVVGKLVGVRVRDTKYVVDALAVRDNLRQRALLHMRLRVLAARNHVTNLFNALIALIGQMQATAASFIQHEQQPETIDVSAGVLVDLTNLRADAERLQAEFIALQTEVIAQRDAFLAQIGHARPSEQ